MTPEQERGVLAGEHALGVLEGEELSVARRLVLSDPDFAAQVQWWDNRLAAMAEEAVSVEPSDGVWPAIEQRLGSLSVGAREPTPLPTSGLYGPKLLAALGATAAAAAAITLLVMSPATMAPSPAPAPTETQAPSTPRYVAQAQSEDGSIQLAGLVDPAGNSLQLRVEGLAPAAGQSAELWAVPEGGAPRSLGAIPADGTVSIDLNAAQRSDLGQGAALAITYEDSATIPHPAPTSDILVVGPLTEV